LKKLITKKPKETQQQQQQQKNRAGEDLEFKPQYYKNK
jgi:hypothetical protein